MNPESDIPHFAVQIAFTGDVSGSVVQRAAIEPVSLERMAESARHLRFPRRYGHVPKLADPFVDHEMPGIFPLASTGSGSPGTVAIFGPSGAGKTQLAAAEAERAWRDGELDLLVWVSAISREAVRSAYAPLVADLVGGGDPDIDEGIEQLLRWFSETEVRWLVVFDGLADRELQEFMPPRTETGRVIVTTRVHETTLGLSRGRRVGLARFTDKQAESYLRRALPDGSSVASETVAELADALGGLPVALSQVSAYLRAARVPLAAFVEHVREKAVDLGAYADSPPAAWVAAVSMAVAFADATSSTGVVRPLLEFVRFLDYDGIPAAFFTTEPVLAYISSRAGREVSASEVRHVLLTLGALELLTASESDSKLLCTSLITRQVLRRVVASTAGVVAKIDSIAGGLASVWPPVAPEPPDPLLSLALRANVERLREFAGDRLWHEGQYPLLLRAGQSLRESGLSAEAMRYFDELRREAAAIYGAAHPVTVRFRLEWARGRRSVGLFADMGNELEELHAALNAALGPSHPDTRASLFELAYYYGEAGNVAEAVAAFERLLHAQNTALGPDHPDALATRNNLAQWRGASGAYAAAVDELEELLADEIRVFGLDHPHTLTVRNNLAQWRGEAGDPQAAVHALRELLLAVRPVSGSESPQALTIRHNLSYWNRENGAGAAAVAELEKLLDARERLHGPDHPDTVLTRAALVVSRGDGDYVAAISQLQALDDRNRRAHGAAHPTTLACTGVLASVYRQFGFFRMSQNLNRQVLRRLRRRLSPEHPDTLRSAANLASDHRFLGAYTQAGELDQATLEARRRVLGSHHPETLRSAECLAIDFRHLRRYQEALTLDEETLEARRSVLGPGHLETVRSSRAVDVQRSGEPPLVFISYDHREGRSEVGAIIEALQANGMRVWVDSTDLSPGENIGAAVETQLGRAEAFLAVVADAEISSWMRLEVELALRTDRLVIPVFTREAPAEVRRSLPYGLTSRQGIRLHSDRSGKLDDFAWQVASAIANRRGALSTPVRATPGEAEAVPADLEATGRLVREAFELAGRRLRPDDSSPQILWPGPVWIAEEASVRGLTDFSRHLSPGQLGYLVHTGELPRDARVALDDIRLSGTPIVTISARSLRAAYADRRVPVYLSELERDYGNRDNLFDTKNALVDERYLFGRDRLLNSIGSALNRNENILVTGLRKVGKTSLLNILRQRLVDRPVSLIDLQRFERQHGDWPTSLFALMLTAYDNWGRAEHEPWPFTPRSPLSVTELEEALELRRAHLRAHGKPDKAMVVILDELERVYPLPGEEFATRQWIRASGALRVLAQGAGRHISVVCADLRANANRDNEFGTIGSNPFFSFFQETPVRPLDEEAVDTMVREVGRAMAIERVTEDFTAELYALTGGHPSLARTIVAEACRGRAARSALTRPDLRAALDRLHDEDAIGYFLRNSVWQPMTVPEREVLRALVFDERVPDYVSRTEVKQATSSLRAQGLINPGVRIGLLRDWIRDEAD